MLMSILILVVVFGPKICDSSLVMLYLTASCVFLVCNVVLDESSLTFARLSVALCLMVGLYQWVLCGSSLRMVIS
jgi:hypothetical protein